MTTMIVAEIEKSGAVYEGPALWFGEEKITVGAGRRQHGAPPSFQGTKPCPPE